jgi:hypothetical protein
MDEMNLHARGGNLLLGDLENPNKMPFSGILTYLGVPSDQPPGGSGGRKVLIPVEVGRAALDSLKGMPINLAASMDDHAPDNVIGVIEDAWIGEETDKGVPLHVRGHIFAKSFPDEAYAIKASQAHLGFSYETARTKLEDGVYNGEPIAIARSLVFTGAAILYKRAAAYQSTSLAAKGEESIEMIREEIEALKQRLAELELEARKVSSKERKELPDSDFAVPGKRKLLINDATHVKLAWDMVDRTEGLTPEERAEARRRILRKAKELGIDTSNWTKKGGDMKAATEEVETVDKEKELEVKETEVEAAKKDTAEGKDESLDKKDVELDSQLVKLLPQVIEELKSLRSEINAMKNKGKDVKASDDEDKEDDEKEDKGDDMKAAAAQVEPQRRSLDSTKLISKFDGAADKGEDIFASIEQKYNRPEDSIAAKLAAIYMN